MSRVVNISSSVTVNLTSFSSSTFSRTANTANGVNSSANTSSYATFTAGTRNTAQYAYYVFGAPSIPSNATISSVSCVGRAYLNNSGRGTAGLQLMANNTAKGSETTFTNTSQQAVTIASPGTWTVSELSNTIKLRVRGTRTSNNQNLLVYFYGASLGVDYTVAQTVYEVSVTNSSDATVSPSTQEIVSGGSGTITFTDIADSGDIVVKDNGTDVTSQLVYTPGQSNTASVGAVAGASYGFSLDGQYYKSQNVNQNGSAALCRLTMDISTPAVLTIYFVNYAEATYDYGLIGNLDTALTTSSAVTNDSTIWRGNESSSNTSTEQSITVNVPAGSHFIDFKYRKDNYTGENNDAFWFRYTLEPSTGQSGYTYTLSNVSADHTITVEDSGPATFYNVNATSSYAGATVSPSTQSIRESRNATVNIAANNLYEITVKDNGTNVTSSLVENATGWTYTVSNVQAIHNITVEEATNYSVTTTSSFAGASAVANPTKVYAGRSSVVTFTFDHLYEFVAKDNGTVINVPEPVPSTTIERAPASFVTSASSYYSIYATNPTGNGLTYASSTTYCEASSNTAANSESMLVYQFDCSSIPQNAVIESVVCTSKASASTTYFGTRTMQLYNGDTAKGSPTTISNNTVQTLTPGTWTREELNDIRVVTRVVRTTSTTNQRFRFYGATLTVTYSVPASYTINNVQTNHTITIEEAPYYGVTFQNSYTGATFSVSPTKIYQGQDAVVTINVEDIDEIHVFDNGTNVDSSIVSAGSGVYTYSLTNVTTAHTISTTESTKYVVNASSNYTGVTISPATVQVVEGKSKTFSLEPHDDSIIVAEDVILTDNNVDVTSQLVTLAGESGTTSGVLGTFDSGMSEYSGIYNNYEYTRAEGNSVSDAYASTTNTRSSFYTTTGSGSTILVVYNLDVSSLIIPDNATIVNVSCQSVHSIAYSGQGFTEITAQLYSGTQPRGTATIIKESSATTMQDASAHTYTIDGGSGWTMNDLSQAKIALYGLRNDTNSNNDNTGIRDNVNFHGADIIVTYALPGGCTYTVSNVHETHTLLVSEKPSVTYNVTCQSTYTGATISPASSQVKQGRNLTVTISASNLYEICVRDGGVDVTSALTGSNGEYYYTIQGINSARSIVVEEATKYGITATSQYAGATMVPATQQAYVGRPASVSISVADLNDVTLEDNGVDVTELIVFESGTSYQTTCTFGSFDSANSDYSGIYSSYDETRAEYKSVADGMADSGVTSGATRSSFYPEPGSGNTITISYNFDTQSLELPSNAVIYNVSSSTVCSVAYGGQGYDVTSLQLYSGLEPMGEATVFVAGGSADTTNSYPKVREVDGGASWTQQEIAQARIVYYGVRNDINSNNETAGTRDNISLHGGELTVTYGDGETLNGYSYTINSVTTGHTLVLREAINCEISTTSYLPNVSITSSTESVKERGTVVITITGETLEGLIVMDNGIDVTTALVFDGGTAATYTITNVHGDHSIVATAPSVDADYIKNDGEFRRITGYYKKINGVWTLISRESFQGFMSSSATFFGGVIEYHEIGEVTTSGNTTSIAINDDALPTGDTYTLKYEDANRMPLEGMGKITDFTL